MPSLLKFLCAIIVMASYGAQDAAALIIDTFDDSATTSQSATLAVGSSPKSASSQVADATVLGGQRDLLVSVDETDIMPPFPGASATIGSGFFSYASNSLNATDDNGFLIQWDGVDAGVGGGAGTPKTYSIATPVDLSPIVPLSSPDPLLGAFGIRIGVLFSDVPYDLTITVFAVDGSSSSRTLTVPATSVATNFDFLFSDFTAGYAFGSQAERLAAITLQGTPNSAGSTTIFLDQVEFIPEPGSFTLLGLGALGLIGFQQRKRRRAKQAKQAFEQ